MASNKKVKLWDRLKYKYKLSILNETSYEVVFTMRLSQLHVLTALSVLAVVLVSVTILLIAFTGLREFIPGFPDGNIRREITENALRVDSLASELEKRDRFLQALQMVLRGEEVNQIITPDSIKYDYDTIRFNMSDEESDFRAEMEEKERFNLSVNPQKNKNSEYFHFFPPVEGIISRSFEEKAGHFGTDVVAKANAKVSTVLDGVVIFTDWTIKTGYVIQVQHANNLISIYKHNSTILKKQGDYVRAGEVIGVVGNTGEETTGPHLHFELWRAGTALNPEDLIKFK